MKSILVTGGAGFIGKHLVRSLGAENRLIVVDIAARPKSLSSVTGLVYRRLDAYKVDSLFSRTLHGSSIVHLAADVSVEKSVRDPMSTVRSNIGVTCAMLEFARKIDCQKFILTSTAAVYGNHSGACVETDPASPESPYAVSKLACEHYCKLYSQLYGIPTVILRLFNVYGPEQSGEYAGVITRFLERAITRKSPIVFGDGRQTRDFVYIDDAIRCIKTALRKPLPGGLVLNVGTGKATSINSLASAVMKLFDIRQKPVHSPSRKGDIRNSLANASKARVQLGFRPEYGIHAGLRETADWFRDEHLVS